MSKRYTSDHEWVEIEDDVALIGITDYAQEQLGDIVYVELPETGTEIESGEETVVIESVKAAGEVKSPLSGLIVEVNRNLEDTPETLNLSPEDGGWLYKVRYSDESELNSLMDHDAYQVLLDSLD